MPQTDPVSRNSLMEQIWTGHRSESNPLLRRAQADDPHMLAELFAHYRDRLGRLVRLCGRLNPFGHGRVPERSPAWDERIGSLFPALTLLEGTPEPSTTTGPKVEGVAVPPTAAIAAGW